MKIGIFSNYEFNYETMEVKGSGVYRYQLDMSKKRGETTDRDLFRLMTDLKTFLQLKNNWNRGRDKDILQSMTKIYGLLGICSTFKLDSFTKDFEDDKKIYYVDYEKIDLEYIQNEVAAFNSAFTFFMEKVGFSNKKSISLEDKKAFMQLLKPCEKHLKATVSFDAKTGLRTEIAPLNMLGVAYKELESLFYSNTKIRTCDFYECKKEYTLKRKDQKCCSSKCAAAYRRDKKSFKDAYKNGGKKTIERLSESYADHVINDWKESI